MKKVIIFLTLSAVSFIILSFVVLEVSNTVFKKKQQVIALNQEAKTIPQLYALLSEKDEQIKTLEKAFIKERDLILVAQSIDSLAAEMQVTATLHFEKEKILQNKDGDPVMPISITIEGKYDNALRFLDRLRGSKYLFTFSAIDGDSPNGIKNENKIIIHGNLYASNSGQ